MFCISWYVAASTAQCAPRACPYPSFCSMALVDSVAAFKARVEEIGLGDLYAKFVDNGFDSHAAFAFSSSYQPSQSDEKPFIDNVITPLVGEEKRRRPMIRRLFFESFALVTASMREKVEATDEDRPKKMSNEELQERRKKVMATMRGLDTEDEHDPSIFLINTCYSMHTEDLLKYIDWAICGNARAERVGQKKDKALMPDGKGFVKETTVTSHPTVTVSTDLQVQNVLIRRGIALEIAYIMSYEVHDELKLRLVQALTSTPPTGYNRVGLQQVKEADQMFFDLLARKARGGIKKQVPEGFYLDALAREVLQDSRFTMLLNPLPRPVGRARSRSRSPRNRRTTNRWGNDKGSDYKTKKGDKVKGGGKGKNKGKDKGKQKERGNVALPKELLANGVGWTDNEEPICFGYNTSKGCDQAEPGMRCPRGWHVCAFKGCFAGDHSYPEHKHHR